MSYLRHICRSLVAALATACGTITASQPDAGSLDANLARDAFPDVACVDIKVTNADLACTVDSDCHIVAIGSYCVQPCVGCGVGTAAVNASTAAHIASLTSTLLQEPTGGCGPCEEPPTPRCLHGQCAACPLGECAGGDAAADATALVPCTPECGASQVCEYPASGSPADAATTLPSCTAMPVACNGTTTCTCLVEAMCASSHGSCGHGDGEWIVQCGAP